MYLAPIESATVLSISETATRSHKSVPIPNHRKLIGSVSDNQVPDRNLDAFPYSFNCKFQLMVPTHPCIHIQTLMLLLGMVIPNMHTIHLHLTNNDLNLEFESF